MLYKDDPGIPIPARTLYRRRAVRNETSSEFATATHQSETTTTCATSSDIPENADAMAASDVSTSGIMDVSEDVENDGHEQQDIVNDISSETESDLSSDTDLSDVSSLSDTEEDLCDAPRQDLSNYELEAMCIVSFLLKHRLTAVTAKDAVSLLRVLCPESNIMQSMTYDKIMSFAVKSNYTCFHYCSLCNNVFPINNADDFRCRKVVLRDGRHQECNGLRYKGSALQQMKPDRQPCNFFLIADVENQIRNLIQRPGIWEQIQHTKRRILQESGQPDILGDIVDGSAYRKLCKPGMFLSSEYNLSAIVNFDGVPLYSSSSTKLWPIFLSLLELRPEERYSRDCIVLSAIWQGKGNPPFAEYLAAFGEKICDLYTNGFEVKLPAKDETVTLHIAPILCTLDLQAKAYALEMTMHNGAYGCATCEESGRRVQHGNGTAQCYPFRHQSELPPLRNPQEITRIAQNASKTNRIKGIHGLSGLATMPWFNLRDGVVPDYMHGVLMGATKSLAKLWFSPCHSKEDFFIGKHLKEVSQRLLHIKPPDFVERLPRDLEKQYLHLKATELQNWLLFYGPVCLINILPDRYFKHFLLLSEAIHLLLGDSISTSDLNRAEQHLIMFYQEFAGLYGEGSCGLNIHNIGAHLVYFVRMWGGLQGWSCFGFEDANATLLQASHGTGDVTKQVLKFKEAQIAVASIDTTSISENAAGQYLKSMSASKSKKWKKLKHMKNCEVAGAILPVTSESDFVMRKMGVSQIGQVKKCSRVLVNNSLRVYASDYMRMRRRICHIVLLQDGNIVSVEKLLIDIKTELVYLVGFVYEICQQSHLFAQAGSHLSRVKQSEDMTVSQVENIVEKLFYIDNGDGDTFVSCVPNSYGHGVFK